MHLLDKYSNKIFQLPCPVWYLQCNTMRWIVRWVKVEGSVLRCLGLDFPCSHPLLSNLHFSSPPLICIAYKNSVRTSQWTLSPAISTHRVVIQREAMTVRCKSNTEVLVLIREVYLDGVKPSERVVKCSLVKFKWEEVKCRQVIEVKCSLVKFKWEEVKCRQVYWSEV
jgi:hypothetical protein